MMKLTEEEQAKYDSYKPFDISKEVFFELPEYSTSSPSQNGTSGVKLWRLKTPLSASNDDAIWFVGKNNGEMNNYYKPTFITLQEIHSKILIEFPNFYNCSIENNQIIVEEEYQMSEDEKNSDDCCDNARENGEMIIEKFPTLEISEYYCHRNKYAIVNLKIKHNIN